MFKQKKVYFRHRMLLAAFISLLVVGVAFQLLYVYSWKNAISVDDVQRIIYQKEQKADAKMEEITRLLTNDSEDELYRLAFEPLTAAYFVYKDKELVFWSDNKLKRVEVDSEQWKYYLTPNAHILARNRQAGQYTIVSYLFLKYNFPYENNELSNDFDEAFDLNKNIKIVTGKPEDPLAVYDTDGKNYLFTLQLPSQKIYDENLAKSALLVFFLTFLLMFYLYANFPLVLKKRYVNCKEFMAVSGIAFLLVCVCLKTNIPSAFFQNNLSTSFHYATNTLLATLTHLTFFTMYVFSTVYLYAYYVKRRISGRYVEFKKVVSLLLPAAYFLLMFYVLIGLVFNSSTYLNVLRINDLTAATVWNHFLMLIWGIGYLLIFIKTHRILKLQGSPREMVVKNLVVALLVALAAFTLFGNYALHAIFSYVFLSVGLYLPEFSRRLMCSKWYFAVYLAFFSFFLVSNSIRMNSDKKINQYRLLAENLYFTETSQEEKFTVSMLEELEKSLMNDGYFRQNVMYPDSVEKVNKYLNNKYLRGFWNKYDVKLFVVYPHSEEDVAYRQLIDIDGRKIKDTHFYKTEGLSKDMAYLGVFEEKDRRGDPLNVFMEFYVRSSYKSYSYPNLLVESPPTIQSELSLSVARYAYYDLIHSSGTFKYPKNGKWIQNRQQSEFFTQDLLKYRHYIYAVGKNNYMVISEGYVPGINGYAIYFLYTFVVYFILCSLVLWANSLINRRKKISYNLSSKLFISFISLMLICFTALFFITLNYTREKYKERQLADIGLKKNYIQTALQEKYYWTQRLDSTMISALSIDLQELAYTYRTDINVYDNAGMLITSSRPEIFSRNLASILISPRVYFSENANIDENEHIGKLEYMATYTDFVNGYYLPIGFISIPQFLSRDEFKDDVQSFLVVIAHISLIVIVLFVLISILVGRRLTAPLTMIENRLKDISLGRQNKKIDYKGNDEIGGLIAQYNRTVDELEQSARLLATSERESAWKLMARQVAHEINNPLTPMKLTIQQMRRAKKMKDERFDAYFDKSTTVLIEQIENLSRIAGTFSSFARLPEPVFEKVDVAKKAGLVTQLFSNNNENIEITYRGAESGVFAYTDREQLIQVFNNLLKNAIQAIPAGKEGEVEVRLDCTDKIINIYVKDNGKGVSDEIKEKLFTPNFTTKSTGMGLGLAISRNIIRASGGEITFDGKEGKGTVFHVRLDRVE